MSIEQALQKSNIPPYMHDGIIRYVEQGCVPGHFLQAIITNNLIEAVGRADDTNVQLIPDYVRFFYNHAPRPCWRSKDNMTNWARMGGLQGQAKLQVHS